MKEIKLKVLDEKDQKDRLSYKEILLTMLKTPQSKEGLTIDDIRQSVKIMEKLEAAKDSIKLEDAEYLYLQNKIKNFKWAIAHKNIVQFIDDYNNAREV